MSLSTSAPDYTKLLPDKLLESNRYHHYQDFRQVLLKAQGVLNNKEKQTIAESKSLFKDRSTPFSQDHIMPLSNDTYITHDSIRNATSDKNRHDNNITKQLFNRLYRPLPNYLRPRHLNTHEWFYIQNYDILLDKKSK